MRKQDRVSKTLVPIPKGALPPPPTFTRVIKFENYHYLMALKLYTSITSQNNFSSPPYSGTHRLRGSYAANER